MITGPWAITYLLQLGQQLGWDPVRTQALIDQIHALPEAEEDTPSADYWQSAAQAVSATNLDRATEAAGVFLHMAAAAKDQGGAKSTADVAYQALQDLNSWTPGGIVSAGVQAAAPTVQVALSKGSEAVKAAALGAVQVATQAGDAIERTNNTMRLWGLVGLAIAIPIGIKLAKL